MLLSFDSDILEIVSTILNAIPKYILLNFFLIVNFKIFLDEKNSCNFSKIRVNYYVSPDSSVGRAVD